MVSPLSSLQRFVLAWADELPTSPLLPSNPSKAPTISPSVRTKRKRTPLAELSPIAQPSPSMPQKKSIPSAKPRRSGRTRSPEEETLADDETPVAIQTRSRSPPSNAFGSPFRAQPPAWPPHVLLGQIPKLPSGSVTESSPSRASRASSPNKKRHTATLQTLDEYPIKVKQYQIIDDLPSDVHHVYKHIYGLVNGLPIIPRKWKDFFAKDLESLPELLIERLLLPDEELPLGEVFEQADLAILGQVQRMAVECEDDAEAEPAWNCDVHSPLFSLAFRRSGRANCKNIATARMSAAAKIRDDDRAIEKLVDFGVTLDESIVAKQDVVDRLRQLQAKTVGINQSIYAPLLYRPLALSIETKASSSDDDEAHAQLSVWTASQFKILRRYRWEPTSLRPLPTLPVVSTYKGSFVLHFAIPQEHEMLFVKNAIKIGDVTKKLDIWKVYLALRKLEDWAVEVYAPWFRHEILGKEE